MIIKSSRIRGTGNSVADYNWDLVQCDECCGDGYIEFNFLKEMLEYLYINWISGKSFLKFVRNNVIERGKHYYKVVCQECEGRGVYEIWY